MKLYNSLKVLKIENGNGFQDIYLEHPDDKSKVIKVYTGCDENNCNFFYWSDFIINLENIKLNDVRENLEKLDDDSKYYYKGCEIFFEHERDTWELFVTICGSYDLDIKYRNIDAGSLDSPKTYENMIEALGKALNIIDESILKKKEENLLYEKANNFYYGNNIQKDYKKAFEIFKNLADNNEHLGAMEALCYMYYYGYGIDANYELARKYCEKVVQKNTKCSKNIFQFLGEMYLDGLGGKADYIKSKMYFEKALNDKCDDTYYKLGLLNSENHVIEKDEEKADEYFNKIEEDLLLSIIYLLLGIRPEEEQNLEGIYKYLDYSREEYSQIIENNIPFDHSAAIYYKKLDYLQDKEYTNIAERLKEKIKFCLQENVKIEKGIFTFASESDVYEFTNMIVNINK